MALMPMGGTVSASHSDFSTERDILYKLIFDLKKDMNDLKQMIYDVAQHQGYIPQEPGSTSLVPVYGDMEKSLSAYAPVVHPSYSSNTPILLEATDHHENMEETLLLADREKEFIVKALRKHKNRRRDAANELGISERTLYRKIKEYDINE
jgi:DNA-binding NtrC family response regulator